MITLTAIEDNTLLLIIALIIKSNLSLIGGGGSLSGLDLLHFNPDIQLERQVNWSL